MNWLQKLWQFLFKPSPKLAVPLDRGKGQTVVLLHGIATDYRSWKHVVPEISKQCRVVALDLLGFGTSPKPEGGNYTAEDHARAVIATLRKKGITRNAIFVGHSMGALVAVEVAKQKPKLASRLILVGMPVYRFDRRHRMLPNQDSIFQQMYSQMLREKTARRVMSGVKRLRLDLPGFGLDKDNLLAFQKSLANTIMGQATFRDVGNIKLPIDLLVGRRDIFVIRRHLQSLAKYNKHITLTTLNQPHEITYMYGKCVAEHVNAAIENRPVNNKAWRRKVSPRA